MPLDELRQLVQSGRYTQALQESLRLSDDPTLAPGELAHVLHIGSVAAYKCDDLYRARSLVEKAERAALAAGEHALIGRIWINQLAIYHDIGDTPEAMDLGEKIMKAVDQVPVRDPG